VLTGLDAVVALQATALTCVVVLTVMGCAGLYSWLVMLQEPDEQTGMEPSAVKQMVAPGVESVSVTCVGCAYVPGAGLNTGGTACASTME
jgi:hypothetical protein